MMCVGTLFALLKHRFAWSITADLYVALPGAWNGGKDSVHVVLVNSQQCYEIGELNPIFQMRTLRRCLNG